MNIKMTNDEILKAAKEATNNQPIYGRKEFTFSAEELQRFASIIEKRTIERCAIAAEYALVPSFHQDEANCIGLTHRPTRAACAAAIRKLGEQ